MLGLQLGPVSLGTCAIGLALGASLVLWEWHATRGVSRKARALDVSVRSRPTQSERALARGSDEDQERAASR
jgi:hypothetical protein